MLWWDVMRIRWCYVVLRAPMDGLWKRSHMGKLWFTPSRLLWLVFSSERVVEVSAWCITHVRHTRVNINVGSIYILFSDFHNIKTYMYYIFKSIRIIKRTLVVFDLVLARWGLENVFRPSISFKRNSNHRRVNIFIIKAFHKL